MTIQMQTSEKGIARLIHEEGCILRPYLDRSGYPTIGIGNRFYENSQRVKITDPPITRERAADLFRSTLQFFEKCLNEFAKKQLTQNQFDACISLMYNIGPTAFAQSTLLRLINKNPNDPKITHAFLMWRRSGKHKNLLLSRRRREARIYFTA